jgi:hypothetical protein
MNIVDLLCEHGLLATKAEGRRACGSGVLKLNNKDVFHDKDVSIGDNISLGKRKFILTEHGMREVVSIDLLTYGWSREGDRVSRDEYSELTSIFHGQIPWDAEIVLPIEAADDLRGKAKKGFHLLAWIDPKIGND